jgi:hypothetical protein
VRRGDPRISRSSKNADHDVEDSMTLQGTAFLAIWHDIAAEGEPEYNLWHTREHMPERVGIPGVADPSVTSVKTAETELKKEAGESVFDGLVMVEGIGRRELEAIVARVEALLTPERGVARTESAVYDLAYLLTPEAVAV